MAFLKYYNLLRLTIPTKKGIGFVLIFIFVNLMIINAFFFEVNTFTLGFAFLFIVASFVTIMYTYQVRFNPSHPIYQFPITYKERVRNDYVLTFFSILVVSIGLVLFGYLMLLLFSLFGDVTSSDGEDPVYVLGSLYNVGYLFLMFSLFMPLSYVKTIKNRYLLGAGATLFLVLYNAFVERIVTGEFFTNNDIRYVIEQSSYGLIMVVITMVLSVSAFIASYTISKRLNKYE